MVFPVPGHTAIGTPYHRLGKIWKVGHHTGVDFPCPKGSKVVAARAGKVLHVGWNTEGPLGYGPAYGFHVIVIHQDNTTALYAHLTNASVKVGQHVKTGQRLGSSGDTGHTFGPHLHFEVRKRPWLYGSDINPMPTVKFQEPA